MDEVLPGLWVGGVRAAMDVEYLSRAGITHIITCMKQQIPTPPPLDDGRLITRAEMKHVRIDDDEKAPILVHFASCNEFIAAQLEEEWVADPEDAVTTPEEVQDEVQLLVQGRQKRDGRWGSWQTTGSGTVLVHCQAGCSRSVAIVAAYLMHTRRICALTAVSMIHARRKDAEPNRGFMAQLELYEQVGFEVDMKWQAVRRFLMGKTDILNGDSMDDMLLSYYPSPYPSPALGTSSLSKGFTAIRLTSANGDDAGETSTKDAAEGAETKAKNSYHQSQQQKPLTRSASSSSSSSDHSSTHRIFHLSSIAPSTPTTEVSSMDDLKAQLSTMSTTPGPSTLPDATAEVKVTANSSGRLPGGVSAIRGHESANNRGSLPKPNFTGPKLRCKGCRRELAALDHVVIHEPGKGQLAFEHRKRDAGHSGETVASKSQGDGPVDNGSADKEQGSSIGTSANVDGDSTATSNAAPGTTSASTPPPATSSEATKAMLDGNKRPIQSAASLASQLPPHLAALRGNRPRPVFQPQPTPSAPLAQVPSSSTASPPDSSSSMHSMLKSAACSSYFIEPMAWMTSLSSGEVTGRLNCPTAKCGQKLGSWDWAGMQCGCGAWVTPAFSLHRSKVDEI